jgi:two-component system response regulator VicR
MEKNKKILIVEDERPLADAIKLKLEINNFIVFVAKSVTEAFQIINDNKIDFIWLDHYLPGEESGLDFVIKIRSSKSVNKNIPIFVVSNTAGNDKIKSYINFGINKYYVKSDYSLEDIISDLKAVLK